jgi:RimJ/RimL family protein N-acetyltransferase
MRLGQLVNVEVRQCTESDLAALVAREPDPARRLFEVERYEAQERGECALLLAWDGDTVVGRVRLRWWSKYVEVLDALGEFPEINALDAWPQGQGIGTQIVVACEQVASERGDKQVGIGVEITNTGARRLYERLGYEPWGDVIDEWNEVDADGNVTAEHHDPCVYLTKNIT